MPPTVTISSTSHFFPVTQPVIVNATDVAAFINTTVKAQVNIYHVTNGYRASVPEVSYMQFRDLFPVQQTDYQVNFDIHDILADMVGFPLPPLSIDCFDATENLFNFNVGVVGYYIDSSVNWHAYPEIFVNNISPYLYATNTMLPLGASIDEMAKYVIPDTIANEPKIFLTNAPDKKSIAVGDSEFLAGYSDHGFGNSVLMMEKGLLGQDKLSAMQIQMQSLMYLGDSKHYFVNVGSDTYSYNSFSQIDQRVHGYTVWLAELGSNLFVDGDNGTMYANTAGLIGPNGNSVGHDVFHSYITGYAARINAGLATSHFSNTYTLMHNTTAVVLDAFTEYYLSAHIYLQPEPGFDVPNNLVLHWNLAPNAFTDIAYFAYPLSMEEADIYERWIPLVFRISVGSSAIDPTFELFAQRFGSGTLANLTVFVDDIKLQAAQPLTEKRTLLLDHDCHVAPTRVHFINQLGGMDSFYIHFH